MEEVELFRNSKVKDAIERICKYFDDEGLNLYECWHVCECIEVSAFAIMGEHMREVCQHIKDADMGSISSSAR